MQNFMHYTQPEPRGLTLYLAKCYPTIHPDASDVSLLDTCYGSIVTFIHSGCPGVIARKQVNGVVQDVKTDKYGDRHLLVKVEGRPFPEWINVNRVQFLQTKTPASIEIKTSVS